MSSYDDLASPADMRADGAAAGRRLGLADAARRINRPAPSLHFDEQPAEAGKPRLEISETTARIAAALHFHLE